MKLSRNRFPHLAAGAAALPFASRVAGKLYAEVMETQLWRSNVGIAEFGQHNLHHLGSVCVPITQTRTYWRRSPPTSACDTNVSDPLNWARDRRIVVP
jgi:hypothetical protein